MPDEDVPAEQVEETEARVAVPVMRQASGEVETVDLESYVAGVWRVRYRLLLKKRR